MFGDFSRERREIVKAEIAIMETDGLSANLMVATTGDEQELRDMAEVRCGQDIPNYRCWLRFGSRWSPGFTHAEGDQVPL